MANRTAARRLIPKPLKRAYGQVRQWARRIPQPSNWLDQLRDSAAESLRRPDGPQLSILDDLFPDMLSAFRVAEFNAYLQHFGQARLYSNGLGRLNLGAGGKAKRFTDLRQEYEQVYPDLSGRVKLGLPWRLPPGVAYCIFLNNSYTYLPAIERARLPFAFTLYPGGGFALGQPDSDAKLRRVCASPFFRKVIVTQKISQSYLLNGGFCTQQQVELIYGGVLPAEKLLSGLQPRQRYLQDKQTFDMCFVANKYLPRGEDKGYDLFVAAAQQLCRLSPDLRFHVVGPFGPQDIPLEEAGERFRFYGLQQTDFFRRFYPQMDLILSPNRALTLRPGAFDGFPTGACVEAGLCGTAVFCTDPLNLNLALQDGEEIVLVPEDADQITKQIAQYFHDYAKLVNIMQRGQAAFQRIFSNQAQLTPRFRLLENLLSNKD